MYIFDQWEHSSKYPTSIIDDNIRTDYGGLNRLVANERNREVLTNIIKNETVTSEIMTKLSFDPMYDNPFFISLLFYTGKQGAAQAGEPEVRLLGLYGRVVAPRV